MFVLNSHNKMQFLHQCRKLMQIRYQKDAGIEMHKCLVGLRSVVHLFPVISIFKRIRQTPVVRSESLVQVK